MQMAAIEELRKRRISAKGQTRALCAAAFKNNLDMIHCLINLGADVNAADDDGKTALDYATQVNAYDIIKLLQSYADAQSH